MTCRQFIRIAGVAKHHTQISKQHLASTGFLLHIGIDMFSGAPCAAALSAPFAASSLSDGQQGFPSIACAVVKPDRERYGLPLCQDLGLRVVDPSG